MFTFARSLGNDIGEKQGRHLSLNGCLLFFDDYRGEVLIREAYCSYTKSSIIS